MDIEIVYISKDEVVPKDIQDIFNNSLVIHNYSKISGELKKQLISLKTLFNIVIQYSGIENEDQKLALISNFKKILKNNSNSKLAFVNNKNNDTKIDILQVDIQELIIEFYLKNGIFNKEMNRIQIKIILEILKVINEKSEIIREDEKTIPVYTYPIFLGWDKEYDNIIINKKNSILIKTRLDKRLKDRESESDSENEYKISGYLQYSFYNSNNGQNTISIDYIEVHPSFQGFGLCKKLISLLIAKYPSIKKFSLANEGGIFGYKCYISTFRSLGFIPKLHSGKNITLLNKNASNNMNKIRAKTLTNSNIRKLNNKYRNTITFNKN